MPARRDRLARHSIENEKLIAHTRELVAASLDALTRGIPDTFLGRKTQEAFPKEQTRNLEATDGSQSRHSRPKGDSPSTPKPPQRG